MSRYNNCSYNLYETLPYVVLNNIIRYIASTNYILRFEENINETNYHQLVIGFRTIFRLFLFQSLFFSAFKRLLSLGPTHWQTAVGSYYIRGTCDYIKTERKKCVIHTLLILCRWHVQGDWQSLSHAMTAVGKKEKINKKNYENPTRIPYGAVIILSLVIKHFCDTTRRLIFQRVLSSWLAPSLLPSPTTNPRTRRTRPEKIATKIHTPSNIAFPETAYLMHETCRRRRLNKTVAPHHHPESMYIIYIHKVFCVCILMIYINRTCSMYCFIITFIYSI